MDSDLPLAVAEKLKKREFERQAEVTKRKLELDSATPAQENADYFSTKFGEVKSLLEKRIQTCESLPQSELTSEFDAINESFRLLQKYMADSTMFLPKYDVKIAQEALNQLQVNIQEKKDILLPKKKFAFRSKKKLAEKVEKREKNGVSVKKVSHVELADCKLVDLSKQTLQMDGSEIEQKDVALARLSNCFVRLFGAPSTVHIKDLNDCTILCGPVSSSIFISDCTNCVFVIACQQLRTHTSKDCTFYLHVTSRAIIEDCTSLEFAPYNLEYPNLDKHFEKARLDPTLNNWSDVDDFNWLASDAHSPNWSILPEEKRKQSWHGN
ncbi:hypothetical protein FSP39_012105 [Pinctada imbricata]|uniref:C-CAP/cofactor C-like domain-containing protein n=1 Tax=Pinctada imbricata TaxID=66713 RepID=A0AA89BWY0_PINIB|nr:hypothetical protein FSP39_012105 [Pinctada imbricata]